MARPKCCRRINEGPVCTVFKPAGVPGSTLERVVLTMDELEAIRLADLDGLYHEAAASKMNVSRQTFGRIIESARHKVARVLTGGLALHIEGGSVEVCAQRIFKCRDCNHTWCLPHGSGRPPECPACKGGEFYRSEERSPGEKSKPEGGRLLKD